MAESGVWDAHEETGVNPPGLVWVDGFIDTPNSKWAGPKLVTMMGEDERIAVLDLADDLKVRKQRLFKVLKKLGIRPTLRRESARRGQNIATISPADAARVKQALAQAGSDFTR
jgi:hypothetical protein